MPLKFSNADKHMASSSVMNLSSTNTNQFIFCSMVKTPMVVGPSGKTEDGVIVGRRSCSRVRAVVKVHNLSRPLLL